MRSSIRPLLALFVALAACAGIPTKYAAQKKGATSLLPADLEIPDGAERKEPVIFRARIHADQEVRRLPFWRKRLEAQIGRVNAYLHQAFGVSLETEVVEWERKAAGAPLEPVLEELATSDPGGDVDWVIGVIAPTAVVTTSHHELGMAKIPGRYFVVRSMNDAMERKALDEAFDALDDSDREALFTARREHKELTVFLHEFCHTLGALHEGGKEWVMNLGYHHHVSGFSPDQAALIRLGVEIRVAEKKKDGRRVSELWTRLGSLLGSSKANFFRAEREHLLAHAHHFMGGAAAPAGAAPSEQERAEIAAALAASEAGHHVEAVRRTEALLAGRPNDAWLKKAAVAIYARAGALTKAEALAEAPGEIDRLLKRRRFYGLPRDTSRFGVPVEREPEYVVAFEAAYEALTQTDAPALRTRSAQALKRFPGAPGLLALACGADFLAKRMASARTRCKEALAAWDETVLAHFFAGQIEPGEVGRRHLERVLDLDPTYEVVIRELLRTRPP